MELKPDLRELFKEYGRQGGKKSWNNKTPQQQQELVDKMSAARTKKRLEREKQKAIDTLNKG